MGNIPTTPEDEPLIEANGVKRRAMIRSGYPIGIGAAKTIAADYRAQLCYYRDFHAQHKFLYYCPMCDAKLTIDVMVQSDKCPLDSELLDRLLRYELYEQARVLMDKGCTLNAYDTAVAVVHGEAHVCIRVFITKRKIREVCVDMLINGSLFNGAHRKDAVVFPLDCISDADLRRYLATQIFLLNMQFVDFQPTRRQIYALLKIADTMEVVWRFIFDAALREKAHQHVIECIVEHAVDRQQHDAVVALLSKGFVPTAEVLDAANRIGNDAIRIALIMRLREYCTNGPAVSSSLDILERKPVENGADDLLDPLADSQSLVPVSAVGRRKVKKTHAHE